MGGSSFDSIKTIFQQLIAAIMTVVAIISSGNLGKVYMTVPDDTAVTTATESIEYEIVNGSFGTINTILLFGLSVKVGDDWVEVPKRPSYTTDDISISIRPLSSAKFTLNIKEAYGVLLPGEYTLWVNYDAECLVHTVFTVTSASTEAA